MIGGEDNRSAGGGAIYPVTQHHRLSLSSWLSIQCVSRFHIFDRALLVIRGSRKKRKNASALSGANSISSSIIQALSLGPCQLFEGSLQGPTGDWDWHPVRSWSEPSSS